jgi:hypothetical protein
MKILVETRVNFGQHNGYLSARPARAPSFPRPLLFGMVLEQFFRPARIIGPMTQKRKTFPGSCSNLEPKRTT